MAISYTCTQYFCSYVCENSTLCPCAAQPQNTPIPRGTPSSQVTASGSALAINIDSSTTVSEDVGSSNSISPRTREMAETAAQLQDTFVSIIIDAKICFMEKEEVSTHFLKKFQFMLTNLSLSIKYMYLHFLKEEIKVAKCVDEIFDILEPYWYFKEYALLEKIIEKVGTSELQKEMKEYILKFEEFEKKITVEDYYSAILQIPAYFESTQDLAQCSLYDVRQLKNDQDNFAGYCTLLERMNFK